MKRLHAFNVFLSGLFVLLLGACVHKPVKSEVEHSRMAQAAPLPSQTVLLQEARTEAEQLRAELASLKILLAKQSGELRTLHEQSQGVQQRDQERGMEIQNIRSELMASQAERDQLRRRNMELEGQISGLANTTQLVEEIQTLRTSFQQVMANMKNLSTDLTLIKKAMHVVSNKPTIQHTALSKGSGSPSDPGGHLPDSKGRVVIQEGDTLWKLANRHHVSVKQLKDWNDLSSNLIITGLRLRVVSPDTPQEAPPDLGTETDLSPTAPLETEAKATPLKNHPQEPQPKDKPVGSEPKNLLSISTP